MHTYDQTNESDKLSHFGASRHAAHHEAHPQESSSGEKPVLPRKRRFRARPAAASRATRRRLRQAHSKLMNSMSSGFFGSLLGTSLACWLAWEKHCTPAGLRRSLPLGVAGFGLYALMAMRQPQDSSADICQAAEAPAMIPYDQLVLPGNRGLRNAYRLTAEQSRALADMLANVPRSPESDTTVHALIQVLHDKTDSPETRELIDKLGMLIDECEAACRVPGLNLLVRLEEPLVSWKFLREGASTSTVLAAGIQAARAAMTGRDDALTGPHSSDKPGVPASDNILQYLGAYEPWKDHLRRHIACYESSQSLIHDLVDKAMDALSDLADTLPDPVYRAGCVYLAQANQGELLAQWVAEECLKDAGFTRIDCDDWLRQKLASHFRCPGLSEHHIGSILRKLVASTHEREMAEASEHSPRAPSAGE